MLERGEAYWNHLENLPQHPDSFSSFPVCLSQDTMLVWTPREHTIIAILGHEIWGQHPTWSSKIFLHPQLIHQSQNPLKINMAERMHTNTESLLWPHERKKKVRIFIYLPFTVRPSIVFFTNTPNSSVFPVAGFCKARIMRDVRRHSITTDL